ncbi:ABC transporter permease [Micromonospora sp. NPDC049679]|uniref:ABC transporter permease n=1 Tax=Micromonospora sp. NPDC049679 TaxID=3155920 RepID=UPI0033F9530D
MAYDDSTYRRPDAGTDSVGTGSRFDDDASYRADTDFRSAASGYQTGGFASGDFVDPDPMGPPQRRPVSPATLDDVFDDPAHGERGRDRMAVHILWEVVLLAAAAGLAYLLYRDYPAAVHRPALDSLLVYATGLGLLALGAGLTLRSGAPNLAIGPVAIAAALHFAENGDRGVLAAVLVSAGAAAVLGLVVAVLAVGFHVPGWAASLAAALAVIVFIQQRPAPVDLQGQYDPARHALYLFGGFVTLALVGAAFGSIKAIRRAVGRFRPVGDPAERRGNLAVALTGGSIVVSMIFAAVAGVLLASSTTAPVTPSPGIEWTGLGLGIALLAGTSAFGRRGGVAGTVLAVALLTLFITYADLRGWNISLYAVAAAAVAGGLLVTRLVESFGRPPLTSDNDLEWESDVPAPAWTSSGPAQRESWSSALPAQPTEGRTDAWDGDRWGGGGR